MDLSKVSHLPLAALMAAVITVGMPALARLQPKPAEDVWTRTRPPTFPAAGTLLYEGQPVKDAVVIFMPDVPDGVRAHAAFGTTDEVGRFVLRTFSRFGDGAVAGGHRVKVECMVPTGRILYDPSHPDADEPIQAVSVVDSTATSEEADALGYPEMRNTLPVRFADPCSSGLRTEVMPDVANEYLIRIHAEPPSAAGVTTPGT